jgi:hypothetical protein
MTDDTTAIDPYTLRHLDAWLEHEVRGDSCRDEVRTAMLELLTDDPEYWSSQGWWNVYDRAKCDRIEAQYR